MDISERVCVQYDILHGSMAEILPSPGGQNSGHGVHPDFHPHWWNKQE